MRYITNVFDILSQNLFLISGKTNTCQERGDSYDRNQQSVDNLWITMNAEEFIESLRSAPKYSHINIDRELIKMKKWCAQKEVSMTESFILRWLDGVEKEIDLEKVELKEKESCDFCSSTGSVAGIKDGYRYAFRCPLCTNWDGVLANFVPLWSDHMVYEGFELFQSVKTKVKKETLVEVKDI